MGNERDWTILETPDGELLLYLKNNTYDEVGKNFLMMEIDKEKAMEIISRTNIKIESIPF